MNKICYQLLDEYLGPCLALGWRFLEKYLAASRCLLLSAVCRSRVPQRGSKYSSIRRFKYLTLLLLSESLVTDYSCCHYVIIISNPSCLRNSLLVRKTPIVLLLAQLFLMQHRYAWIHQLFLVSYLVGQSKTLKTQNYFLCNTNLHGFTSDSLSPILQASMHRPERSLNPIKQPTQSQLLH